jgi:hypothetical protein
VLKNIATSLGAAVCLFVVTGLVAQAFTEIPEGAIKAPLLVQERSVSTYVASDAAPGAGLAVNIIYPQKTRYAEGAPLAVVVPGTDSADGLSFSAHTIQCGFAEVRFAFPGGGVNGFRSSGIYDYRGAESQQALRDILLFVSGKTTDTNGKHIFELGPQIKLSTTNIGIIAWSNGGNCTLACLAKYPDKLHFVSWVTFYESPVGPMFFPPNLGGDRDLIVNKHYRQGSCATGDCLVDYRKLAYQSNVTRDADQHKKRGEPVLPGVIFFDENKNNIWDESTEFAFSYAIDVGLDKQIYPPDVTAAMQRMGIFRVWDEDEGPFAKKLDKNKKSIPDPDQDLLDPKQLKLREKERLHKTKVWVAQVEEKQETEKDQDLKIENGKVFRRKMKWPTKIANLAESEAFYDERDGSQYVDTVCAKYPWLLVTVFASQVDHLQRQTDHPHIALLYNAFIVDKAHWVRLNPDPIYVANLGTMNPGNFVNNKPNAPIDASAITDQLEPEGLVPDYLYMDACAAELADRTRSKEPTAALAAVLVDYPYGAGPMPKIETVK